MTTSSSSNVREVVDSQEVRAREFLNSHPHIHYVNKEVFYFCYHKIQRLLDYNLLFPLLMSHELARNSDDAEKLTSSYHQPHDRHIALLQLAERGGEYGFMLLYMCISATCSESRGHAEAVGILDSEGESLNEASIYSTELGGPSCFKETHMQQPRCLCTYIAA